MQINTISKIIILKWKCIKVTSIFIQYVIGCNIGYIGMNSDVRCPFPLFGLDCQSTFDCSEKNCDYVKGCTYLTSGIYFVWLILPFAIDTDLSS